MSINRVGKDVVCIHDGIPSNYKKSEMMPFTATWVQLEITILSAASQKEKDHMM